MRSNFHMGLYVSDTKALLAQTPPLRNFLGKPNKLRFDQNDIIDPFYPCFPPGSKQDTALNLAKVCFGFGYEVGKMARIAGIDSVEKLSEHTCVAAKSLMPTELAFISQGSPDSCVRQSGPCDRN